MKEEEEEEKKSKPPKLNEKSGLVTKMSVRIQEQVSDSLELNDIIGKSGYWQVKILILTLITSIPTSWNHLGMSFLAYPVDHWCARPEGSNISLETWWSEFLPNATVKEKTQHSQCEMYFYNVTSGRPVKTRIIPCDSFEYSSEFDSIVNKWNIVCNDSWLLSSSQTIYMLGFLIAVMFSGHFADKFGRQPAIMLNIVILIVAGFAVAASNSFLMFTISRFFVAVGHGGMGLVTYILLIEAVGSEYRVRYMYVQGFGWHCGYMIFPLIAWLQPNWLHIQLIITAPSIIFLTYFWLLPESPRWLLANGNYKKALPILKDATKMNGKEIKDLEGQAKILSDLKAKQNDSMTTCFDLLRTPNLRMKTLCLYFIWAVIAFTYYGISLNTNDLQGDAYVNFFLSGFMEIPSTVICLVTLDRFGRKKPFFLTLLLGGLACFACIFIPYRLAALKTGFAMVGKMFNSASFSIVYIYSAEIFPTVARNVGVGSSSTIARIGSAIAPFMRDLGNATNPSVPMVLFGALSIISALIVLKMPETNNQPMPDSIDDAENFGKQDSIEFAKQSCKMEESP